MTPEARWSHLKANARQSTIGLTVDPAMVAIERDNPAPRADAHPRGVHLRLRGPSGLLRRPVPHVGCRFGAGHDVERPQRQARVRASGAAEAYGRALEIAQARTPRPPLGPSLSSLTKIITGSPVQAACRPECPSPCRAPLALLRGGSRVARTAPRQDATLTFGPCHVRCHCVLVLPPPLPRGLLPRSLIPFRRLLVSGRAITPTTDRRQPMAHNTHNKDDNPTANRPVVRPHPHRRRLEPGSRRRS